MNEWERRQEEPSALKPETRRRIVEELGEDYLPVSEAVAKLQPVDAYETPAAYEGEVRRLRQLLPLYSVPFLDRKQRTYWREHDQQRLQKEYEVFLEVYRETAIAKRLWEDEGLDAAEAIFDSSIPDKQSTTP